MPLRLVGTRSSAIRHRTSEEGEHLVGAHPISVNLSKASAGECISSRRDSMIVARHEVPGLEFGHFKKARRPDSLREAWRRADCIIGVPPVFLSRRPPRRCQAQDEEGFSWFAASLGLPARSHHENRNPKSALWISKLAPGETQAGRLCYFWTDILAFLKANLRVRCELRERWSSQFCPYDTRPPQECYDCRRGG